MLRDKKRIDFMDVYFSLCMSLITVINQNAVEDHFFLTGYVFVKDVLYFAVFFCLFYATTLAFKYLGSKYDPRPLEKAGEKKFVLPALLMWCAHIPYLIILAPGLLNYDTINQVRDVFDGVSPVPFGFVEGQETVNVFMNAHHPVVIAFLFAAFIKLGVMLGDPGKGLFIYCFLQSLAACFVLSVILTDLENKAKDSGRLFVIKAVRLFFTFTPFIPYYTICMLKNTVHSLLFLILLFGYYKYLKGGDVPYEDEKFSYMAFVREKPCIKGARILRHPITEKGMIKLSLCTSDENREAVITKKQGELFKAARKASCGDVIDLKS